MPKKVGTKPPENDESKQIPSRVIERTLQREKHTHTNEKMNDLSTSKSPKPMLGEYKLICQKYSHDIEDVEPENTYPMQNP